MLAGALVLWVFVVAFLFSGNEQPQSPDKLKVSDRSWSVFVIRNRNIYSNSTLQKVVLVVALKVIVIVNSGSRRRSSASTIVAIVVVANVW